jgi:Fur family transcriptional regulator, stress-responsive regulator
VTSGAGTAPERLRHAGLRATRPRVTVLRWLDANPGHHPADRVVERTALSRATVYHVLGQLSGVDLVLTAEPTAGPVLYETAADRHHHFVCRSCGRIIDVACLTGETPCLHVDVPGALVEQADVTLRGVCPDCT